MPSFILIRPIVWPQCTNVTDRTDNGLIALRERFYKRSPKNHQHHRGNAKTVKVYPISEDIQQFKTIREHARKQDQLECGPMTNVMAALPNISGALCSTPQSLADAHY